MKNKKLKIYGMIVVLESILIIVMTFLIQNLINLFCNSKLKFIQNIMEHLSQTGQYCIGLIFSILVYIITITLFIRYTYKYLMKNIESVILEESEVIKNANENIKKLQENQYIMQRQAQFAILGEFAGGIAHDLNSPLSSVSLDISTLRKYMNSEKISADTKTRDTLNEMLENIDSSINKMSKTIEGVRNQIRSTGDTEKEYFNLKEVIDGLQILFGSVLLKGNCSIENLVGEDVLIYGEQNKLDRVLSNLIKNSIDAYAEQGKKGKITVFSKILNNSCIIGVEDHAGGLSEEIAKTMFKEMKTTKTENGTGFGLYYSNTIIEGSFGGKMSFDTEKGKGTTFYIEIPISEEEK